MRIVSPAAHPPFVDAKLVEIRDLALPTGFGDSLLPASNRRRVERR